MFPIVCYLIDIIFNVIHFCSLPSDEVKHFIFIEATKVMAEAKNQENIYENEINKLKRAVENHDIDKIIEVIEKLRNTIQGNFINDFNEYQM